jgi:N-acetylmuramoyl-L-alanine amidase
MRLLCLLLLLLTPVWADPSYFLGGQRLNLKTTPVGQKSVFLLADPEVQRLIASTKARLQVSTTGRTLYCFLPGRESFWSDGSGVYTRNGKELEVPGQFLAEPAAMEPAALFEALGLSVQTTANGVELRPLVCEFTLSEGVDLRLQTSASTKYTRSEPEAGLVCLSFKEAAWEGERRFRLGEAEVEVVGGEAGSPLEVRLRFLPFWTAVVKNGFTQEVLISPQPANLAVSAQNATLLNVTQNAEVWEMQLDQPVQFGWARQDQQLLVEFPSTTSRLEQATLLNTTFPITRYRFALPEGQAFEFFQANDRPNSLFLRVGPAASLNKVAEATGLARMSGFAGGVGYVVLDPGHGGGDPGCRNRELGVYEKDVTLDICLRMRSILESQGWRVEMTRTTDRDVTYQGSPDLMELQARADVANRGGADIFVSVHCNASVSTAVRGSSIYWWKPQDQPLAACLDVLDGSLGFEQDGLIQNNFAVLRLTDMPAVLVETAFLTNAVEGRLLANPQIRQAIAQKLADGLGRYMAQRAPTKPARRS